MKFFARHLTKCAIALCFSSAFASLSTDGPHIVNTETGKPVHLKCVNWYGAHQELFSVGGLERQSIRNISRQIVRMGSNCVRLPLSIDLVRDNPPVLRSTIQAVDAAECPGVEMIHGMELLDCVIHHLTAEGLMIILNNHVSKAGWVGTNTSNRQGLWNLPGYPTSAWVQSLYNISARYRDNHLFVGVDIRNEIHDQVSHYYHSVVKPVGISSTP
jgi:endoglucanase